MYLCFFTFVLVLSTSKTSLCEAFGHEDSNLVCGNKWQSEYGKLHHSILNGSSPQKYLISIPVQSGTADNIFGYIAGFLWSILSDRAFLILKIEDLDNHCSQRTISFAYDIHSVNWTSPTISRPVYECMLPSYYYRENRKCFQGSTRLHNTDTKLLTVGYKISVNDDGPNGIRENFQRNNLDDLINKEVDILFFSTNRGVSYNIFQNPHYKEKLLNLGLRPETAFSCIFHYLFKINNKVCKEECKITESRLKQAGHVNSNTIRIGIQIRHQNTLEQHILCAESLAYTYRQQGKHILFLLVTAFPNIQEQLLSKYGNSTLLLPAGNPRDIITVGDRDYSNQPCSDKIKDDQRAMIESARDIYLLSLTDIQVISASSGFGILGGMSRPRSHPIMYRVEAGMRQCNESLEGDPLSLFANDWSGFRERI